MTERCVEALHGLTHVKGIYRKVTPAYASLYIRLPSWEQQLRTQPEMLAETVHLFRECRKRKALPELLGLAKHPRISEALASPNWSCTILTTTACVIYGDDDSSKYAAMAQAKKAQKKHTRKQRVMRHTHESFPTLCTWPHVKERAMIEHFKLVASQGRLYSMPLAIFDRGGDVAPATLMRMESKLKRCIADDDIIYDPRELLHRPAGLMDDGDGDIMDIVVPRTRLYFSVVEPNPSKARTIPVPPGASAKLGPTDVLIALHTDHSEGWMGESGVVSVAPSQIAVNPLLVLSRFGASIDDVIAGLEEWRVGAKELYVLRSLPYEPALAELTTKMLLGRATPKGGVTFASASNNDDETTLLQRMAVLGYVECASNDGTFSQWRFTNSGMRDLQQSRKLHSPSCALRDRGVAILDKTAFELILALQAQGWAWEAKAAHRLPPYRPGERKVCLTWKHH